MIAAETVRAGGGSPLVLMLHGSASHGDMWKPVLAALPRGTSAIAPDLIGYRAGPPWSPQKGVTLADEVAHLLRLLPAGRRLHVVGYSYGGAVALQLASAIPARIDSLMLVEPVVFPALRLHGDEAAYAAFERWHGEFSARLNRGDAAGAMREFIDQWSGAPVWDGFAPQRREQLAALARKIEWDWKASFAAAPDPELLRSLGGRTLLVRGDRSPAPMLALVGALQRLMRDARLAVIPGANHLLALTHASELASLLRWRVAAERPA